MTSEDPKRPGAGRKGRKVLSRPPQQLIGKQPKDFTPEERALFDEYVKSVTAAIRGEAEGEGE